MKDPRNIDTAIIRALQVDGRASFLDIAKDLGAPRATVATRVQQLLDAGTVRVIAAVDPSFLGQRVIAHVSVVAEGPVRVIANGLVQDSDSVLVSAVGGDHDLIAEFRVANHEELHRRLADVRRLPGVAKIDTLIYTSVIKGFFISKYTGDAAIDAMDTRLIELLQADGRSSYRQMAGSVGLSATAVRTRVQRLLEARIIKISAVEARGAHGRQLSMGVGLNIDGDHDEVIGLLRTSSDIEFAAETVGRFDAVATLVGQSPAALFQTLEVLRALPGIKRTVSWSHLDVLKEDYARRV
ncbi:Lrp/AsnC family transcriptional regulator [Arthrobacter sp. AQ5-05]|uniref:Lrp/AsnC family transcriptional regulator n=1 Tax=Arthrobacter sp. AQ5-05 TaxID=2184581 RepID=UPI000DCE63EE|nr:Lrp/AsnC family transcriptional regulator [Arthrobacter sp. AQ5-05]RAX49545.1 Lrp/AsnC family transcriptional regulator [Arthrobacter sp. AQ5-05]